MKFRFLFISSLFLICTFSLYGQDKDTSINRAMNNINQAVLQAQLDFLASDWTEGRETGKRGEYLAADYIASLLKLYGVKPGGDYTGRKDLTNLQGKGEKTYFQNFILIKTTPDEEQIIKIRTTDGNTLKTIDLTKNIDFIMRPPDKGMEIEAPVVFVGYGFKNEKLRYDDFSKLDLKGRFILKLSGNPGFAKNVLSPSELSAASRESESTARKMGAIGIIEFNPNSTVVGSQPENEFLNMSPSENNRISGRPWADYSLPGKNSPETFIRITVSVKTANEILDGTGFILEDYIKRSESGTNNPLPPLMGKSIYLKTTVKEESIKVRNVIGVIEGKNPDQVIVLGAHYDHMGILNGYTWNGADDNGSGTVGVLTIAKATMETGNKPDKTLIFALWTAEEEGFLGSRYFVDNLTYPIKNLRLNINFDMISRYVSDNEPKKVAMIYTEAFPVFRIITEENLKIYGIDLDIDFQPSKDPPGGSDHRSFTAIGIPVMRFKPGHREEYHTPADETETVNWDIMEKIVKISFVNVWELANKDW